MATINEDLEGYLEHDEAVYGRLETCLEAVFSMNQLVNQHNGREAIHVLIAVGEEGESVDFYAPRL